MHGQTFLKCNIDFLEVVKGIIVQTTGELST